MADESGDYCLIHGHTYDVEESHGRPVRVRCVNAGCGLVWSVALVGSLPPAGDA